MEVSKRSDMTNIIGMLNVNHLCYFLNKCACQEDQNTFLLINRYLNKISVRLFN